MIKILLILGLVMICIVGYSVYGDEWTQTIGDIIDLIQINMGTDGRICLNESNNKIIITANTSVIDCE